MNGILEPTHVQALRSQNPDIDFVTPKWVGVSSSQVNLFDNAPFYSVNETDIASWKLTGAESYKITKQPDTEKLYSDHNVLRIKLDKKEPVTLQPKYELPWSIAEANYTFGMYARSDVRDSIVAVDSCQNEVKSAGHSGGGGWEFIGALARNQNYWAAANTKEKKDTTYQAPCPAFKITGDVDITAPTFAYGKDKAMPGASLVSSASATFFGPITMGIATINPPLSGKSGAKKGELTLPKEGNIFKIKALPENRSPWIVRSINKSEANWFKEGTLTTLMFEQEGTAVKHSEDIKLLGGEDFVAAKYSTLTLLAEEEGKFTEVTRNTFSGKESRGRKKQGKERRGRKKQGKEKAGEGK